ncbi:hypothetical protein NS183_11620 [Microbacterium testaceum]|nr:hypothetical protein [Microbacterium testaceum]KTS85990.1 hypothetical protein NS183_11620 [Microbacterium testaceum]
MIELRSERLQRGWSVRDEEIGGLGQGDARFVSAPKDAAAGHHVFEAAAERADGELAELADEPPLSLKDATVDGEAGAETVAEGEHRGVARARRRAIVHLAEEGVVGIVVELSRPGQCGLHRVEETDGLHLRQVRRVGDGAVSPDGSGQSDAHAIDTLPHLLSGHLCLRGQPADEPVGVGVSRCGDRTARHRAAEDVDEEHPGVGGAEIDSQAEVPVRDDVQLDGAPPARFRDDLGGLRDDSLGQQLLDRPRHRRGGDAGDFGDLFSARRPRTHQRRENGLPVQRPRVLHHPPPLFVIVHPKAIEARPRFELLGSSPRCYTADTLKRLTLIAC